MGSTHAVTKDKVTPLFLQWRSVDNPPTRNELHEEMLDNFQEPIGGVAVFVKDGVSPGGVLKVLHGFLRHPGQAGEPTAERRKTFCFVDKVVGTDIHTVSFDSQQLTNTPGVNVSSSPARHQGLLDQSPDVELSEPLAGTDQNMQTLKICKAMFVPYELVPLLIGQHPTGCIHCGAQCKYKTLPSSVQQGH